MEAGFTASIFLINLYRFRFFLTAFRFPPQFVTLLKMSQEAFIKAYFKGIQKVFTALGMDAEMSVKAIWAGTKAMISNDGVKLNQQRFWEVFSKLMQLDAQKRIIVEEACDRFYSNEFDAVKSVLEPSQIPKRLIHSIKSKGYNAVLATNPLFPECAVTTRLNWIGLNSQDFTYITHYSNSSYCKPNPEYYREILRVIDKKPEQCLMAGNNANEDMSAAELGIETYLVTDYLENESGIDITAFRKGSLAEFEIYLSKLLA